MQQMVDFPTQVKGNILDLVITNIPERIEEIYEMGRLGKSDHVMIVTKISVGGEDDEEAPPAKTGGGQTGRRCGRSWQVGNG